MRPWVLILLGVMLLSTAMAASLTDDDEEEDDEDTDDDANDDGSAEVETGKSDSTTGIKNPCLNKTCRRGETCLVDKKYRAKCVCHASCPPGLPEDDRFQVCSKGNITYESECALDRDHCLCRRKLEGCSNPQVRKIRLDYFGPCQRLMTCSERDLKEFPRRTREWLYVIMKELGKRAEIPEYQDLLEQAERDVFHSPAVLWKFCVLDVYPQDSVVSRRELVYTIQTLKPLENCLMPFLDGCDADSDGQITLVEWGTCLGLEKEKISDVCKDVHRGAKPESY